MKRFLLFVVVAIGVGTLFAIFGYTSEEALGFQAADLIIPPHVRELVDRVWKSLIAQTGGSRQTNENVTKDGRTITG